MALLLFLPFADPASPQETRAPEPREQQKFFRSQHDVVPGQYFVGLGFHIRRESLESEAAGLASRYRAEIVWLGPWALRARMAESDAQRLSQDVLVRLVVEDTALPRPKIPPDRFLRASRPVPGMYVVELAKPPKVTITDDAIRKIAEDLAGTYQGRVRPGSCSSAAFGIDMSEDDARRMALDPRVAYVAESSVIQLPETHQENVPPTQVSRSSTEVALRSEVPPLRRVSRHFRDYYFLAFDETRVDVGTWNGPASETWANRAAMEAVADELTLGTSVERLGPTFLRPPQGFRVTGTEEAVLSVARDARIKWVEEVGPFLRALEARPGEYGVVLLPSALGEGSIRRTDVRHVAEELATRYGGRVTKHIWEAGPVGFGLDNASEGSARAMSEDPRVEYVEENPAGTIDVPTPKVDIDHRGSGDRFRRSQRPNPGTYVVSLREGPRYLRSAAVREIGERLTAKYGGSIRRVFELSAGLSISATEAQAIAMSKDDEVEYVGEDTIPVMDPADLPPPRR